MGTPVDLLGLFDVAPVRQHQCQEAIGQAERHDGSGVSQQALLAEIRGGDEYRDDRGRHDRRGQLRDQRQQGQEQDVVTQAGGHEEVDFIPLPDPPVGDHEHDPEQGGGKCGTDEELAPAQ